MDTELLVGNRIEDGQKLLAELALAGFDVSVAFWARNPDEGPWALYIGSTSVEPSTIGDAYRTLYACLSKIPDPWVSISEVKLVPASDPIARDALVARDRQQGRIPVRFQGKRLGSSSLEDAYIYPRLGGPMTQRDILHTLWGIAFRPDVPVTRPSVIRLRDGNTVTTRITGFNVQMPGQLTIHTLDPDSNAQGQIAGDDILDLQL